MLSEVIPNSKLDYSFDSEVFLEKLVSTDSQVKNLSGIESVQLLIKPLLDQLSFETELIPNRLVKSAPLLMGKKFLDAAYPTVTFIGHSDVVTPIKINPFRIDEDNDRIYGSGVADDKGGVVVCLKAIHSYLARVTEQKLNFNIIISPSEETGSLGFHELFKAVGQESDLVLGLEPALRCGSLIRSRSGNRWYHLNINGISAHSGRFGHNFINASHVLSKAITKFHELNSEHDYRRVNVGSFGGGHGGFNTICGSAWAKIDTRFASLECRDFLHQEIEKIMGEESISCPYSEKVSSSFYSIEDDCPPMSGKQTESMWYQTYLKHVSQQDEQSVTGIRAGGAADINYFATQNSKLLDGLGPVGEGLHTATEYIKRSSLHTRSSALEEFLIEVNEDSFLIRSH